MNEPPRKRSFRAPALAVLALAAALSALSFPGCASAPPSQVAQQWYDLGNAWLDKGDWKKAGEAYSRAIALNPSFAGASFNLARALVEAGDYDGAIDILSVLARRDPENIRIVSAKAYALYKKGDPVKALAAYKEALKLDPYSPDAIYNAALLELASGDAVSATADLDKLVAAKSDDGQAYLLLGRARDKLSQADEASSPRARAEALASFDRDQAVQAFEKAETLGKADADGLERLAALYGARRQFDEQMSALEATVKLDPKRGADWFTLARLRLIVASDSDKGMDALKSALDAGFADKDEAAALLAEPDLPDRAKVLELLKTKSLAQ
jgi:tetratricopeptide (TPR) repeat protein